MVSCGGLDVHGTYLQRLCISTSHCVRWLGMAHAHKRPMQRVWAAVAHKQGPRVEHFVNLLIVPFGLRGSPGGTSAGSRPAPSTASGVASNITQVKKRRRRTRREAHTWFFTALPFCTEFRRTSFVVLRPLSLRLPHPVPPSTLKHTPKCRLQKAPRIRGST